MTVSKSVARPAADEASQPGRGNANRRRLPGGAMVWVLVALILAAIVLSKGVFVRPSNLTTVLYQISVVGVLAMAQAFAVISKGLDLSLGATAILAALVIGDSSSADPQFLPHLPLPLAIVAGLVVGLVVGVVNGVIAGRTPVPPFIITLSTYLVIVGVTFMITQGAPVTQPDQLLKDLGDARVWILPVPVLLWFALIVVGHLVLSRTKQGAMLYSVGGNETAARLSGVPVARIKMFVYGAAGVFAAAAGLLFLARTGSVSPSAGSEFMLMSLAAVVVGGIPLSGGQGKIKDVVLGVLILGIAGNLMNLMLISPYLQMAVQGAIILLAVGANQRLAHGRGQ
ncbi:ribose transport system permease protein/putative xylitol transport system permease protein [Blastococcus colisei]|uniref:Autoinducer 2 import system permease protein LsrD n=1 Tax=Blastococcus colisei TaxID=1564162 RepID=A0A543PEB3_9ACTN|nr:ABC transporter permease [Blastococcus colisei]TQN42387.1 ribose transport system permease protein/putative xylitol transport system permease protein [Blastococcus colisei]